MICFWSLLLVFVACDCSRTDYKVTSGASHDFVQSDDFFLLQKTTKVGQVERHRPYRHYHRHHHHLHHNPTNTSKSLGNSPLVSTTAVRSGQVSKWPTPIHCWRVFICLGVLAWDSLMNEIRSKAATGHKQSREYLWDIAKFCLMCLVWQLHAGLPGWSLYRGWFMPAFFFLSGLVCRPAEITFAYVRKLSMSVLKDNVLNLILWKFLLQALTGGCFSVGYRWAQPWSGPWFLPAMCTCRIGVPLCLHVTRLAGKTNGAILLVAIAFVIPYVLDLNHIKLVQSPCNWPLFNQAITQSWIFYVVGFLTDAQWFAKQLKTRLAACIAFAVVGTLAHLTHCGYIQTSDIVTWEESGSYAHTAFHVYVRDMVSKQFCVVLFLACLAPFSCIGGLIPQIFAQLGQRTLHAYLINVFIWHYVAWQKPAFVLNMPIFLQFAVWILATSVACCPLSEWCVQFITSPQWILDGGAMVMSKWEENPVRKWAEWPIHSAAFIRRKLALHSELRKGEAISS